MLRHKHEFNTGRTSTADNFAFIGFDKNGKALNNSNCSDTEEMYKRAIHLVTLIDVAGINKFYQTLLHGVSFTNPDTALIVIQNSKKDEFLKDYVELLNRCHIKIMAVVLTHCDEKLCCENEVKNTISNVCRSKSEPNLVPLIFCDCKNGFGIEKVQNIMLDEIVFRKTLMPAEISPMMPTSTSKASSKMSKPKQNACFKILETYQLYAIDGTIVTGHIKSGEIKENDILTLGPIEEDEADSVSKKPNSNSGSSETKKSSIILSKKRKRRTLEVMSSKKTRLRNSNSVGNSINSVSDTENMTSSSKIENSHQSNSRSFEDLSSTEKAKAPPISQKRVKVISIEKNRVRVSSSTEGELVSLKIKLLNETDEPVIVKRGAMIYNQDMEIEESDYSFTNRIILRLYNSEFKIDLKNWPGFLY